VRQPDLGWAMALERTWMLMDQLVKKKGVKGKQLNLLELKLDLGLDRNSLCIWFNGHNYLNRVGWV